MDVRGAMLEVAEPSFQGTVQFHADSFDVPTAAAAGLAPDGVLEFIQAFLARPFRSSFKMVPQEVKSSLLASIHYSSFGRM